MPALPGTDKAEADRASFTGSLPAAASASPSTTVTLPAAGHVTSRGPRTAAASAVHAGRPGVIFLSTTGTPGTSWGLGGLHAASNRGTATAASVAAINATTNGLLAQRVLRWTVDITRDLNA